LRAEAENDSERLDELRLGEAWDADEQTVPAGEQGHERLLDHLLLAKNHCADSCTGESHPL
jgi:hypothetical protein